MSRIPWAASSRAPSSRAIGRGGSGASSCWRRRTRAARSPTCSGPRAPTASSSGQPARNSARAEMAATLAPARARRLRARRHRRLARARSCRLGVPAEAQRRQGDGGRDEAGGHGRPHRGAGDAHIPHAPPPPRSARTLDFLRGRAVSRVGARQGAVRRFAVMKDGAATPRRRAERARLVRDGGGTPPLRAADSSISWAFRPRPPGPRSPGRRACRCRRPRGRAGRARAAETCDTEPRPASASSSPTMRKVWRRPSSRSKVTLPPNWTTPASGLRSTSCAPARRAA